MGLAALRKILSPEPFDVATLRGQILAVDADNLVWQFVTAIAGASGELPRGPDGRPNAHLIGLVNRLRLYASWGARSAWIFDGEQPALKAQTLADRAARIEKGGLVSVGPAELDESKELLTALGVPWMVAPAESDAQCAHFARDGHAFAAVTQDWDIALHGAPRALRNLSGSKTRAPELIDLDASLAHAGLTRDQLVDVAILIGTDYNVGVKGVGPVKAMRLVKQHGDLHGALASLGVSLPGAEELRALFLAHPVDARATLTFRAPDAHATRALLTSRGLSMERAEGVAADMARLHEGR